MAALPPAQAAARTTATAIPVSAATFALGLNVRIYFAYTGLTAPVPGEEPRQSRPCTNRQVAAELLDDVQLVTHALAHDIQAYRSIVERYQSLALRTAFGITGSRADAEEVVQDAFVKAYRALHRYDGRRPFRPWLLTIVGNEARNRRRANRSRPFVVVDEEEREDDVSPPPDGVVLERERREAIGAALRRLSEDDRDVITCRYFLDLSEAETAAALGLRRGTVKSRLSRALARMRVELGER